MKSNHLVRIVQCQILRLCPSKSFKFIYDLPKIYVLCSKSLYKKPKYTDCFNDPAFIKLFSQLRVDDRFNLDKPLPSSQVGLATPPVTPATPPNTPINLPDIINGSTVVVEGNTVPGHRDSTKQESSDLTAPQAPAPIAGVSAHPLVPVAAENKTAGSSSRTDGASRSQKKKFYVVTCRKRTGVFNNW